MQSFHPGWIPNEKLVLSLVKLSLPLSTFLSRYPNGEPCDLGIERMRESVVPDVARLESIFAQTCSYDRRQIRVDQQLHAATKGSSRSCNASAANLSQDVFAFQVGVVLDDLLDGAPGGELPEHGRNGHARIADGGQSSHPFGMHGDAFERHGGSVPRCGRRIEG